MAYKAKDIKTTTSAAAEEVAHNLEAEARKHKKKKPGSDKQRAADPGEKTRRENNLETQGRRDCKLPRMNLAVSPTNFEYIRTRARMEKTTFSKIIDEALSPMREKYEKDPDYIEARDLFRRIDAKEDKQ